MFTTAPASYLQSLRALGQIPVHRAAGGDSARQERLRGLLGKAAIANAKLAYARFREFFDGERFAALRARGARMQRPL